jgi:hypothetical protein
MKNYPLKNIPPELYERTKKSATANFRSLNQELLFRVQLSFELEDKAVSALHQKWVDEALASGPARPAKPRDWSNALKRGLARPRSKS